MVIRIVLRAFTALALLVGALVAAAPAAAAASNSTILAAINAERAANGIPAVTENRGWSAGCRAHDSYMVANADFSHQENPALPGYSKAGNWSGTNGIIAMGASWRTGDPYSTAPLHLIQLMNPLLREVGVDEHGGYTCTTTWPGYGSSDSSRLRVYTYPGDGSTGIPGSESSSELPFTPESVLGLPATTGFNIMAWAVGPDGARIASATLTGPGGIQVPLKTVDGSQATLGGYLGPAGAFLIPVVPLAGSTLYEARVSFTDTAGETATHAWHFTTAPDPLRVQMDLDGGRLVFHATRRDPTRITIVLRGHATVRASLLLSRPITAVPFFHLFPHLPSGRFACTVTTVGAGSTSSVSTILVGT